MMKCQQAEQWLLLKDAGELPDRQRRRLEEHLAGCAHCRAYRRDLERVITEARRSLSSGAPAEQTLTAIRQAACAGAPARRAVAWIRPVWQPALAVAAILLLCLGGWFWLAADHDPSIGSVSVAQKQPTVQADVNNDDLAALLLEDVVPIEWASDPSRQAELSPLDRDILLLEGLVM